MLLFTLAFIWRYEESFTEGSLETNEKLGDKFNVDTDKPLKYHKFKERNIEESSAQTSFSHSEALRTTNWKAEVQVHASEDTLKSYLSQDSLKVLEKRTSIFETNRTSESHSFPKLELFRTLSIRGFNLGKFSDPANV